MGGRINWKFYSARKLKNPTAKTMKVKSSNIIINLPSSAKVAFKNFLRVFIFLLYKIKLRLW